MPHPEQDRLRNSEARFKVVPAGRRSGKTEFAKRHLVYATIQTLAQNLPWDDPRFFAAAPTRDQAKRIWWLDLKKLFPREAIASISESDLCIRTHWGAELWVAGLDKAERIEGVSWDGGVVDELANCKPGIWEANIRPALADRRGWCWLIGVPDMDSPGQIEYERMVKYAASGIDSEWARFTWPSKDILLPEEVESARRTMDPRIFAQEYEGEFILAGGRAFPDFDSTPGGLHIKDDVAAYDPALPICWALDFNVNPMCSGVIQHRNGIIHVVDELAIPDTVTPAAVTAFLARAKSRGWNMNNLSLYGDAAGNQRKTTAAKPGDTDWVLVRNGLSAAGVPHRMQVPRSNPQIGDTRNAVNAKIMNGAGEVKLFVHSNCRVLINDLSSALWPSKDDFASNHSLAWLRYFMQWEYPVISNTPVTPGIVAVL